MTDGEKLDLIISEMTGMKNDMTDMKNDISGMKNEMADMKNDISGMKNEMVDMKSDINDIKLTLDNEIRVNIQRVAEGHLDLSRNLHEAMKPNNEIEMLAIKVRMLETDMRELKQKIS
ncbi:MAG: hypothetical protein K2M46_07755 [Lachnospiraceae bacterium]|nr:hypothetical protein [Lachnospiraceae bacterium]